MPFDKIRNRQILLLCGLIGLVIILAVVLVMFFFQQTESGSGVKRTYKSAVTMGTDRIRPQETWMEQVKIENNIQRKRIEALENSLERLIKLNTEKIEEKKKPVASDSDVSDLQNDLKHRILPPLPQQQPQQFPAMPDVTKLVPFRSNGINKISINLVNARKDKQLRTVDNYIPAGSFAPAVVLEGVDASTSVNAQGDPRPITLQVVEDAYLPSNFRSRLKGCFVTAAAAGDMSSERAYVRLEKLSCVERNTGEVIEMNVKGHLVGGDSKSGQRGRLVDRTGPLMRNAAVGGFLAGAAEFMSQNRNPIKFLPSGIAESGAISTGDLVGQGLAKGAGSALDKYAEYYIKRAEQMQPIIEVMAGQEVTILFTEGFSLSQSQTRTAISTANDKKRYQQLSEISQSESVDSWLSGGDSR